ncbi:predicted protein [Uncinocarpus reesii 1704]|uniref:Peptidase S7 domain-containing protein n=1 Tax=Uncinocarpus reesii (strain UAMH 1704) TaxID=336963 RepID=C4JX16_UNCRE|nr:uncharacterized protein UREG_06189 [Uncinocarpus reesii 1704]EEP81324.1 predicted protein [Uncinocarpus reesii 1704]
MGKHQPRKWRQTESPLSFARRASRRHPDDQYRTKMDSTQGEIDTRLPYRKGWPKPLPILPLSSKAVSPRELPDLLPNKEEIKGFLKLHGVEFQFWSRCRRFNDGQHPDHEDITLVIHCTGLENFSVAALEELRLQFHNRGWRYRVEFIDDDQANAPLHCICPDDPIVQEWEEIHEQRVLRMIADLEWQTVNVFRCGTAVEEGECPITVIISAWDAASDVWWDHILPSIILNVSCKSDYFRHRRCKLLSPQSVVSDSDTNAWLSSIEGTIALLETLIDGDPERRGLGDTSKAGFRKILNLIDCQRNNDAAIRTSRREAGSIIATSGQRTLELDGRDWWVDWALVRLPERRGRDATILTHRKISEEVGIQWSSKPLREQNLVFKQGSATGYTQGRINGIKPIISMKVEQGQAQNSDSFLVQGSAWAIIGSSDEGAGTAFSRPGDSGSLILDSYNRIIGLLFASEKLISYFIPFATVVEDIKRATGGRVLTPTEDIASIDSADADHEDDD